MPNERFFTQLIRSVTSARFYQEIPGRRFSEALKYFSILILLVTVILSVRFTFDILKGLASFEEWSKASLPEIVIEKGIASVNAPQPWRTEKEGFVVIMDTTGAVRDLDDSYAQGLLFTRDKLILKRGAYETRRYDLSKIDSFRLNSGSIRRFRQVGQWLFPPLLAVILFLYFWLGKFSQIIFFSLISLLANWFSKRNFSYTTLLTLGIYAITPPLLLVTLVTLLGIEIRFFEMIYLAIYAALLVTAVLHAHPDKEDAADEMLGGP